MTKPRSPLQDRLDAVRKLVREATQQAMSKKDCSNCGHQMSDHNMNTNKCSECGPDCPC